MDEKIVSLGAVLLRRLAAMRNEPEEQVRDALEELIERGREDVRPTVRAFWQRIPAEGTQPTPEELVAFLVGEVTARGYGLQRVARDSGERAHR